MKSLPDDSYEICQYGAPYTVLFPRYKTVVAGLAAATQWIETMETLATSVKIAPTI